VLRALKLVLIVLVGASLLMTGMLWYWRKKHPLVSVTRVAADDVPRQSTPFEPAETIYDGKLGPGWEDWGWGPHALPEAGGAASVVFAGYGGIILHHAELTSQFGAVVFRFKAPKPFGEFLVVRLDHLQNNSALFPGVVLRARHVAALPGGWLEALVPWRELNPSGSPVDRVFIAANRNVGSEPVLLDGIVLTKPSLVSPERAGPAKVVELAVSCVEPARVISPLIYGVTLGVRETGSPINRIGGNTTTRLNWGLGTVWNTGSDWFFENVKGDDFHGGIDDGVRRGAKTALVVPLIGWVAKDGTSSSFPRSKFPNQRKYDTYRPEAGDGFTPDNKPIAPGRPEETSIPAPPELIGKWIRDMRVADAERGARGVHMYILDNEPALWNETHRDVHPEPVGYDELLDRTVRYATAIREADPDVLIAGPAEWGWTNYFSSAKDRGEKIALDRLMHGGKALIPWYLGRLAEHQRNTSVRLLDVLDVHFYPAADGVWGNAARTDTAGAALRIRSTRALWDPDYQDESWIKEPVRLIPRLKEWVAENYPGRQISLGEWSFGADDHVSGGLATAEALGRFGEQGLDAAFYWGGPKEGTSTYWAFRAFRNFDGNGGRFLDWSLKTRSAPDVSLFASRDASTSHVVAILLNLDPSESVRGKVNLDGCQRVKSRRTFRLTADSKGLVPADSETGTEVTLPPYSLEVLDFALEAREP
jgi:hypothetical protein